MQKVTVKTPEEVDASAKLLGDVINMFVRTSYADKINKTLINELKSAAAKDKTNAFAEDIQAVKTAGMNEHVAKPIDLDSLLRVMSKYRK